MDTTAESRTAPVINLGTELTGGWRVVRVCEEMAGIDALLVEDDAFGRAFCFVVPPGTCDPQLDEESAAGWGTVRRVLRDPLYGRVVLDEIPEGSLLADRIQEGWCPPAAWHEGLHARVLEQHRLGRWHGQIAPDRIVIGADGLALPGWGLGGSDAEDARARDSAALSAMVGLAPVAVCGSYVSSPPADDDFDLENPLPGGVLAESLPQTSSASHGSDASPLLTALASDHLPTLRSALSAWIEQQGSEEIPEFLRARDALARLEKKVDQALEKARGMLNRGDSLGAVALCREAVRFGAEQEAEPVLREARKQARAMLSRRRLPSVRVMGIAAVSLVALGLLVLAGWVSMRNSPEEQRLDQRVEELQRSGGERAVVADLVQLRANGQRTVRSEQLLAEHLTQLVDHEQQVLYNLRREVVARGARPRRADQLAEESLAELATLASSDFDSPLLATRVARTLVLLDKAAALYRAGTVVQPEHAVRAVELLLREDPVFQPAAREERP